LFVARAQMSKRKRIPSGPSGRMTRRHKRARAYRRKTGQYLGVEYKFLDCAWNGVAVNSSSAGENGEVQPSSGCIGCISCPATGTTESARNGRKYTITNVWVSGMLNTTSDTNVADIVENTGYFAALVLDKQNNGGTTIVSENVYLNPSTSVNAMLPHPLRNLDNTCRYRILKSQYIPPGGLVAMTDGTNTASVNVQNAPCISLNWKGRIQVLCNDTTADCQSVTDNAIHLLIYAGGTAYVTVFSGKSRVRFVG